MGKAVWSSLFSNQRGQRNSQVRALWAQICTLVALGSWRGTKHQAEKIIYQDLPFLFSLPISRATAEDLVLYRFSWGTLSPARNLFRQQRTWSRRRRHTSPITNNTLPFTISTCIFTMTENRKILPHPPNFTVIIFLSAPNLIPLSQEQTEQI